MGRGASFGESELTRPAAIYFLANVLSSAIPLLLLPVLTRILSPADFGLVAMFSTIQVFLFPVVGLGTKGFVTRQFFGQRGEVPSYLTTCLVITAANATCLVVVFWFTRSALVEVTGLPVAWLFVAILAAAAQFVIALCLSFWQASGQAIRVGILEVLQAAMNAGLSLLLVVGARFGWEGRTTGQVAGILLAAALSLLLLARARHLGRPGLTQARAALAFGLPLVPHGVAGATLVVADRLLIANLIDLEHAGLYTAAVQVALGIGLVIHAFNRAYTPWLYRELSGVDTEERRRWVVRQSYGYFVVLALLGFAVAAASPWIAMLLGETFKASATLIPYLVAGIVMTGMYNVLAGYLMFSRRTGELSAITILSAALSVVASVLLIRLNGLAGAAQAFVLTQAVLLLMTWWRAHRAYPMPWSPLPRWRGPA
jgi:O-antigen/teichoic acid export membrane protein